MRYFTDGTKQMSTDADINIIAPPLRLVKVNKEIVYNFTCESLSFKKNHVLLLSMSYYLNNRHLIDKDPLKHAHLLRGKNLSSKTNHTGFFFIIILRHPKS